MDLFPSIRFILVDPRRIEAPGIEIRPLLTENFPSFDKIRSQLEYIKNRDEKVFSFQTYFTRNFASAIAEVFPEIYFISDIRTLSGNEKHPDSLDILWNMAQQMNWMFVFQPVLSMLKFRQPYYENTSVFERMSRQEPYISDFLEAKDNGVDFIFNHDRKELVYLSGEVDIQPLVGPSSTESRLIVSRPFQLKSYGFLSDWENRYFYYNSIARPFGDYLNPNRDRGINFCNCNDCALENYIWENYLKKYDTNFSIRELVILLSSYVNPRFKGLPQHGHCFSYY